MLKSEFFDQKPQVGSQFSSRSLPTCAAGAVGLFLIIQACLMFTGASVVTRLALAAIIVVVDIGILWFALRYLVASSETEHEDLVATSLQFAHRLALAIELRDPCTPGHNDRVGRYCRVLAEGLGLDQEFCENIFLAAPFHDVGKICVPDEILNKPGPLTDRERDIMERHVEMGATILEGSEDPIVQLACSIVATHHENWDGSGYPLGLASEEIPIEGRIVAVADVFDALLSARPYKEPWPVGRAIEEMRACRGTRFDPEVIDVLESCVHRLITVERELPAPSSEIKKIKESDARTAGRAV